VNRLRGSAGTSEAELARTGGQLVAQAFIRQQLLQSVDERQILGIRQTQDSAGSDQTVDSLANVFGVRPDNDGGTSRGGFQHIVAPARNHRASHERHVGSGVECRKFAEAIDNEHVPRFNRCRQR